MAGPGGSRKAGPICRPVTCPPVRRQRSGRNMARTSNRCCIRPSEAAAGRQSSSTGPPPPTELKSTCSGQPFGGHKGFRRLGGGDQSGPRAVPRKEEPPVVAVRHPPIPPGRRRRDTAGARGSSPGNCVDTGNLVSRRLNCSHWCESRLIALTGSGATALSRCCHR